MTLAENDGESYQQGRESRSIQGINSCPTLTRLSWLTKQEKWTKLFSKIMAPFKAIVSFIIFAEGKQNMEDQVFAFHIGIHRGNSYKPLSVYVKVHFFELLYKHEVHLESLYPAPVFRTYIPKHSSHCSCIRLLLVRLWASKCQFSSNTIAQTPDFMTWKSGHTHL